MPLLLIALVALGAVAYGLHGAGAAAGAAVVPQKSHGPLSGPDPAVQQAALIANASEIYPSRLRAFAATLLPDYPGESALLQGRAAAIDAGMLPGMRGQ